MKILPASRPVLFLVLVFLLGPGLAGCLRTRESVHLALDGSGRIEQVILVDEEARAALVRALADLYEIPEERRGRLYCDPLDAAWIRARATGGKGYRVPLLEVTEPEEGVSRPERRTKVHGVFTTLADAARGGAFLGAGFRLERLERLEGTEVRAWRFELRDGWGWIGDDDRDELGGVALAKVRERLVPLLEGGSLERTVVFPTKVVETNGELAEDGMTVRWRLALADLLGKPILEFWPTFEASDDLVLESCRVDPDATRLLERLLEAPPGASRVESREVPDK